MKDLMGKKKPDLRWVGKSDLLAETHTSTGAYDPNATSRAAQMSAKTKPIDEKNRLFREFSQNDNFLP